MSEPTPRHQLFEAARTRAEWTVQQLWVGYLALGGTRDAFDIEAFLHGLGPLDDAQSPAGDQAARHGKLTHIVVFDKAHQHVSVKRHRVVSSRPCL